MSVARRSLRALSRVQPLTAAAMIAAVLFALIGIGTPLLGRTVFAATDFFSRTSPYLDSGLAVKPIQNTYMHDTWNSVMPFEQLFARSLREGDPAWWNPYVAGGTPMGSVPNSAHFSPLTLPYYVLPDWLAPGYGKLFEISVTILGCYLFLRRLRLDRPAAVIGGVVFAGSAFMVMWTNWPQPRVAAMIPWVFWAVERVIARRRATDIVILALPVAIMLFGGFPAVTAFTLLTAGPYFLVRLLAENGLRQSIEDWRRVGGVALSGLGAVALGVALAAVQLVPFASFYSTWLIEGREQQPWQHLRISILATAFAPWTFGGVREDSQPYWYLAPNMVESSSFVGAAAVVLAVASIAMVRSGRDLLPRGVWTFLVAAAGLWALVIYVGGPLRLLQELPVFSTNFIGRARGILGFLIAVLAAVGLDLLLRRTGKGRHRVDSMVARGWTWPAWSIGVWAAAVAAVGVVVWRALGAAAEADRGPGGSGALVGHAWEQIAIGLILMGVAAAAVAALYWSGRREAGPVPWARLVAGVALVVLITGQALSYAVPYWPRVDRSTFYPVTDVHRFLMANLGHERFVGTDTGMSIGLDSAKKMRALGGHAFVNAELADLIRTIPGRPLDYPTLMIFQGANVEQATSPVLDRLGAKYWVTSPGDPVFGIVRPAVDDGSMLSLAPGAAVTVPVPWTGPLRAVGLTSNVSVPVTDTETAVEATLIGADGRIVATARRLAANMAAGVPFLVPIAAEDVPESERLTVSFTLYGRSPMAVAATGGAVALTAVAPVDDGLKLVYAGPCVVYERLGALPRIRWASSTVVQPDKARRLTMLGSGAVGPDEVILNEAGPEAEGRPAVVSITADDYNSISVNVNAEGSGYLVVADALQAGWMATVDGAPAELVPADQGLVAVAVGAGTHAVELRYAAPYHGAGTWTSLASVVGAIVVVTVDQRRRHRAGAGPGDRALVSTG